MPNWYNVEKSKILNSVPKILIQKGSPYPQCPLLAPKPNPLSPINASQRTCPDAEINEEYRPAGKPFYAKQTQFATYSNERNLN